MNRTGKHAGTDANRCKQMQTDAGRSKGADLMLADEEGKKGDPWLI